MTLKLSEDLRQALTQHGGAPVYVVDDTTKASYVLLRAEQYEKLKAVVGDAETEAMYALLADIAPEDWDDASTYGNREP